MEKYVHISSENKKARLTVLVSCLLNSSNLSPFVGAFFVDFLRTFMVFKNYLKTYYFLKNQ